jgi:hypothetical protein
LEANAYAAKQATTRPNNSEYLASASAEPSHPLAAPATPTRSPHANCLMPHSVHFSWTPAPVRLITIATRVARSPLSLNGLSAAARVKPRNDNVTDVWEFFERGSVQNGTPTVCKLCK